MPIYTRRETTVEARQHTGPNLNVTSFLKGAQVAKAGDFLVVDGLAVAKLREQEKQQGLEPGTLGNRGTIYVMPKDEFIQEFNAPDDSVVPEAKGEEEMSFETLPVIAPTPVNPEPAEAQ